MPNIEWGIAKSRVVETFEIRASEPEIGMEEAKIWTESGRKEREVAVGTRRWVTRVECEKPTEIASRG